MYTCPKCGNENNDQDKFCRTCGFQLKKACPHCGNLSALNQKYCVQCGNKLDAAEDFNKGLDPNRVEPEHQDNAQEYRKITGTITTIVVVIGMVTTLTLLWLWFISSF